MTRLMPITGDANQAGPALARGFPFLCVGVPWAMIEPHERQAVNNHDQSLDRLAARGGLGAGEALAILEDRPWRGMDQGEAGERLFRAVAAWIQENPGWRGPR